MKKIAAIPLLFLALAGCATAPSQAEMELGAYIETMDEKVRKKQISEAEARLAVQQYAGAIRARESGIAMNNGIAASNQAYSMNSTMAMSGAIWCASRPGGHC
jgi:hypothetical protein